MSTAAAPHVESNPSPAPTSDEAILARLATLQDMHDKIFQLRSLLPDRLIDPVRVAVEASRSGEETPIALAAHLRAVVVDGNHDVQAFKALWHSEEMRALMVEMKGKSFPQGRDVWTEDYRGLVGTEKLQGGDGGKSAEVGGMDDDVEDVEEVVEKFRDGHPSVKVDVFKQEDGSVSMDVLITGRAFRVTSSADEASGEYQIKDAPASTMSGLKAEMIESLNGRPRKKSLAYLLDMIVSYIDIQTRPCDKCRQVFDKNLQLPSVRVAAAKADQDINEQRKFMAFHRACV